MPQNNPELNRSLGRIEGKLDSLGTTFIQHIQDDKQNFTEIRLQISAMWKKISVFTGVGVVALAFGPELIKKFFVN